MATRTATGAPQITLQILWQKSVAIMEFSASICDRGREIVEFLSGQEHPEFNIPPDDEKAPGKLTKISLKLDRTHSHIDTMTKILNELEKLLDSNPTKEPLAEVIRSD
jgi:hypothetical protein